MSAPQKKLSGGFISSLFGRKRSGSPKKVEHWTRRLQKSGQFQPRIGLPVDSPWEKVGGAKSISRKVFMLILVNQLMTGGIDILPQQWRCVGWIPLTICFLVALFVSTIISLMIAKTMTMIHGNQTFDQRYECVNLVREFLGEQASTLFEYSLLFLNFYALLDVNSLADKLDVFLLQPLFGHKITFALSKGPRLLFEPLAGRDQTSPLDRFRAPVWISSEFEHEPSDISGVPVSYILLSFILFFACQRNLDSDQWIHILSTCAFAAVWPVIVLLCLPSLEIPLCLQRFLSTVTHTTYWIRLVFASLPGRLRRLAASPFMRGVSIEKNGRGPRWWRLTDTHISLDRFSLSRGLATRTLLTLPLITLASEHSNVLYKQLQLATGLPGAVMQELDLSRFSPLLDSRPQYITTERLIELPTILKPHHDVTCGTCYSDLCFASAEHWGFFVCPSDHVIQALKKVRARTFTTDRLRSEALKKSSWPSSWVSGLQTFQLVSVFIRLFGFMETVPSLVNELKEDVNITTAFWQAMTIASATVAVASLIVSSAYPGLVALSDSSPVALIAHLYLPQMLCNLGLLAFALLTSLPNLIVSLVTARYNLVNGGALSNKNAIMATTVLPFILIWMIPSDGPIMQVLDVLVTVVTALVAFVLPVLTYRAAMQSSPLAVRDEVRRDLLRMSISAFKPVHGSMAMMQDTLRHWAHYAGQDDPQLRLLVRCSNPEERAALISRRRRSALASLTRDGLTHQMMCDRASTMGKSGERLRRLSSNPACQSDRSEGQKTDPGVSFSCRPSTPWDQPKETKSTGTASDECYTRSENDSSVSQSSTTEDDESWSSEESDDACPILERWREKYPIETLIKFHEANRFEEEVVIETPTPEMPEPNEPATYKKEFMAESPELNVRSFMRQPTMGRVPRLCFTPEIDEDSEEEENESLASSESKVESRRTSIPPIDLSRINKPPSDDNSIFGLDVTKSGQPSWTRDAPRLTPSLSLGTPRPSEALGRSPSRQKRLKTVRMASMLSSPFVPRPMMSEAALGEPLASDRSCRRGSETGLRGPRSEEVEKEWTDMLNKLRNSTHLAFQEQVHEEIADLYGKSVHHSHGRSKTRKCTMAPKPTLRRSETFNRKTTPRNLASNIPAFPSLSHSLSPINRSLPLSRPADSSDNSVTLRRPGTMPLAEPDHQDNLDLSFTSPPQSARPLTSCQKSGNTSDRKGRSVAFDVHPVIHRPDRRSPRIDQHQQSRVRADTPRGPDCHSLRAPLAATDDLFATDSSCNSDNNLLARSATPSMRRHTPRRLDPQTPKDATHLRTRARQMTLHHSPLRPTSVSSNDGDIFTSEVKDDKDSLLGGSNQASSPSRERLRGNVKGKTQETPRAVHPEVACPSPKVVSAESLSDGKKSNPTRFLDLAASSQDCLKAGGLEREEVILSVTCPQERQPLRSSVTFDDGDIRTPPCQQVLHRTATDKNWGSPVEKRVKTTERNLGIPRRRKILFSDSSSTSNVHSGAPSDSAAESETSRSRSDCFRGSPECKRAVTPQTWPRKIDGSIPTSRDDPPALEGSSNRPKADSHPRSCIGTKSCHFSSEDCRGSLPRTRRVAVVGPDYSPEQTKGDDVGRPGSRVSRGTAELEAGATSESLGRERAEIKHVAIIDTPVGHDLPCEDRQESGEESGSHSMNLRAPMIRTDSCVSDSLNGDSEHRQNLSARSVMGSEVMNLRLFIADEKKTPTQRLWAQRQGQAESTAISNLTVRRLLGSCESENVDHDDEQAQRIVERHFHVSITDRFGNANSVSRRLSFNTGESSRAERTLPSLRVDPTTPCSPRSDDEALRPILKMMRSQTMFQEETAPQSSNVSFRMGRAESMPKLTNTAMPTSKSNWLVEMTSEMRRRVSTSLLPFSSILRSRGESPSDSEWSSSTFEALSATDSTPSTLRSSSAMAGSNGEVLAKGTSRDLQSKDSSSVGGGFKDKVRRQRLRRIHVFPWQWMLIFEPRLLGLIVLFCVAIVPFTLIWDTLRYGHIGNVPATDLVIGLVGVATTDLHIGETILNRPALKLHNTLEYSFSISDGDVHLAYVITHPGTLIEDAGHTDVKWN